MDENVRPVANVKVVSPDGEELWISPKAWAVSYKPAGFKLVEGELLHSDLPEGSVETPEEAIRATAKTQKPNRYMSTPEPLNAPTGLTPVEAGVKEEVEAVDEPVDGVVENPDDRTASDTEGGDAGGDLAPANVDAGRDKTVTGRGKSGR